MRNLLLFLFALVAYSCSSPTNNVVTTFDDEKSNAIREHYQNYLKNDVPQTSLLILDLLFSITELAAFTIVLVDL